MPGRPTFNSIHSLFITLSNRWWVVDSFEVIYWSFTLVWRSEIVTGEEKDYQIQPLDSKSQNTLTFDVKCKSDAGIALLGSDAVDGPMIEVFIGGWENTKSAIRLNQTKPNKAEVDTPAIVSDEEYRRFWVTFKKNVIEVGWPFLLLWRGESTHPTPPTHCFILYWR